MSRQPIAALLKGGDRRSIGRSGQVVNLVLRQPKGFAELIQCLWSNDPIVRMRAADAAEKASAVRPELLKPYKAELLGLLVEAEQLELRWHLAQMIPRLTLSQVERRRAAGVLQLYLQDPSSIVRTFALQGLADMARTDSVLRSLVRNVLEDSVVKGTAAMKARASKLLLKDLKT